MSTQSKNRKQGDKAETLAAKYLYEVGLRCIEKQATPIKIARVLSRSGGKMRADIFYEKKVSGDFKCVGLGGQYVHVEVKHTEKPVFSLSLVKPHQLKCMQEVDDAGGLALVAWVFNNTVKILTLSELPEKGQPLKQEEK